MPNWNPFMRCLDLAPLLQHSKCTNKQFGVTKLKSSHMRNFRHTIDTTSQWKKKCGGSTPLLHNTQSRGPCDGNTLRIARLFRVRIWSNRSIQEKTTTLDDICLFPKYLNTHSSTILNSSPTRNISPRNL